MSDSKLEREDKVTKFYLNLCPRGCHSAPAYNSCSRPSVLRPWLLGRFRLIGCDEFKQSVSANDGALSAIDTSTSTSPDSIPCTSLSTWVISYVSWCCVFVIGAKKLPPILHCRFIFLHSERQVWKWRQGRVCRDRRRFNTVPHRQHCYVYLHNFVNLFRSPVRRLWSTVLFIIPIYKLWLSAVPCYPFFELYVPAVYFLSTPQLYLTKI